MTTPKYLLAKYIPDLMRQEPRNIGVILWSQEGVVAKFLAERDDRADVDGRSIPSFVTSASAYRQWIEYWRSQISQEEIKDPRETKSAAKRSIEFLDVLKLSNKGNFILEDGGIITEPVSLEELPKITDDLFTDLVEDDSAVTTNETTLLETCEDIITETKLDDSPYFRTSYRIECDVDGAKDKYTFSYAFQNGYLGGLYHRVPLPKKRKELAVKNVHESAWMFEQARRATSLPLEKTAALICTTPQQEADSETVELLKVLSKITRVIDLRTKKTEMLQEFADLAAYKP